MQFEESQMWDFKIENQILKMTMKSEANILEPMTVEAKSRVKIFAQQINESQDIKSVQIDFGKAIAMSSNNIGMLLFTKINIHKPITILVQKTLKPILEKMYLDTLFTIIEKQ